MMGLIIKQSEDGKKKNNKKKKTTKKKKKQKKQKQRQAQTQRQKKTQRQRQKQKQNLPRRLQRIHRQRQPVSLEACLGTGAAGRDKVGSVLVYAHIGRPFQGPAGSDFEGDAGGRAAAAGP